MVNGEGRRAGANGDSEVRSYLVAITDPQSLIDMREVERLERAAEDTNDPIEKLKVLTSLERSRRVDISALEQAFVIAARRWAEENGIDPVAFRAFGVDERVLVKAGLSSADQTPAAVRRGQPRAVPPGTRQVRVEVVRNHIKRRSGSFSLADIAAAVGGSPMTIRRAVTDLISEGKLERLGADPGHTGRGRAPIHYRMIDINSDRRNRTDGLISA